MICSLPNRKIERTCRSVLRFLDRSFLRAMGCFFACFRVPDDQHHRVSLPTHSKPQKDVVPSQNQLSALFLSEEKQDTPGDYRANLCLGSPQTVKELKDEAKFLKACGTLLETPTEIRKGSEKLKSSPPCDRDSESSKFHSWLPNTSIKKLQLDKQPDQPCSDIKVCNEWGKGSGSSEHTPSSCISNNQNTGNISFSSTEGRSAESVNMAAKITAERTDNLATTVSPTNVQCRNKSVHFECDYDVSSSQNFSSENLSHTSKKFESPGIQSVSKPYPYPTPLKLSDEMQTPGTVFPTNMESLAANGTTRIRSQYVFSVSKENISQLKVLKEEDSNSHQSSGDLRESLEGPESATPKLELKTKDNSDKNELKMEGPLSSWLKPIPSTQDVNNKKFEAVYSRNPYFGRTPGDRPILGTVAAHWNEDERSRTSPKWWDGNGIPNSTNKYKEDQKVSWHATPFEERLEKALSEESFISQRKPINVGRPIAFDENEESDTAGSQLQSSAHPKSVVSF